MNDDLEPASTKRNLGRLGSQWPGGPVWPGSLNKDIMQISGPGTTLPSVSCIKQKQTNSASVHSEPCEMYVISNAVPGIVKSFVVQRCFN